MRRILRMEKADEVLFRNAHVPLTRDGVAYLLAKYVQAAAVQIPRFANVESRRMCCGTVAL